jgi:hypothetical protein
MKKLIIIVALALSACAGVGHIGGKSPCVTSITSAHTMGEVEAVLEHMGIQKGLATKTAEALMTSRLTPSQVCDALKH